MANAVNVDWRYVGTFAISVIVIIGGFQIKGLIHRIETGDKLTLEKARLHADNARAGRFTLDNFRMTMEPRDVEIGRLRTDLNQVMKENVELRTMVRSYQKIAEKIFDKNSELESKMSHLEGTAITTQKLVEEHAFLTKQIARKQDDVRENRIPEIGKKLDAHLSSPHSPHSPHSPR